MPLGKVLPDTLIAIDTDVLTWYRNGNPPVTKRILDYIARGGAFPAITATTVFETYWGHYKEIRKGGDTGKRASEILGRTRELLREFTILEIDARSADLAARLLAGLERKPNDELMRDITICATALSHNYAVVTGNKRDFTVIAESIPDDIILRLEFWQPN